MDIYELAWKTQLDFLFKNSGLPKKFHHPINLVETKDDKVVFEFLKSIHSNVEEFVQKGENLVLMSKNVGNGKTSWAVKILQRYMAEIAMGNGTRVSAYFISVPKLFAYCGDFNYRNTEEFRAMIYHVKNADLVVFDELGAGTLNKVNYQQVYEIIEHRINSGKSSIYTTNYTDEQLIENLGERLYSRIVELSDVVEFQGRSNRGKDWSEIK